MTHRILAALLVLLTVACGGNTLREGGGGSMDDYSPDPRPLGKTMVYECADYEFIARLGPGEMAVWLEDRYIILSRVRSASGVKYEEGSTVFFSKGDEAMLELDGERYTSCELAPARAPWEDARRRGVNFRAVGNEPGWHLEIQQGRQILFVSDYGMRRVMVPDPGEKLDGEVRIFHATTDSHDLRVHIVEEDCRDTMKGDRYPSEVSVQINGKLYLGCGRDLEIPWN